MPEDKPIVMLAAGGTGGHLFPAFALAEELGRRGFVVDLATDMRGDRYGTGFPARTIHRIPAATIAGKSPLALAKTGWTLLSGLGQALRVMRRVKPAAVMGFGGYPSFPPLMAAALSGVPAGLHEQNAVLGRANKMLAGRVAVIATSFPSVKGLEGANLAKARFTGNPVRRNVLDAAARPYEPSAEMSRFRLLVFGGSQGARFFSEAVPPALAALPVELRTRIDVVQQAREEDLTAVRSAYDAAGIAADVAPFFKNLPELMALSHLVIGRSGASTVAELAVIGRPSILVPLPHAIDNDQLQNARTLAESGGAWCIPQAELNVARLTAEISELMAAPDRLASAAAAARAQGRPDAVQRLADCVIELVARKSRTRREQAVSQPS